MKVVKRKSLHTAETKVAMDEELVLCRATRPGFYSKDGRYVEEGELVHINKDQAISMAKDKKSVWLEIVEDENDTPGEEAHKPKPKVKTIG